MKSSTFAIRKLISLIQDTVVVIFETLALVGGHNVTGCSTSLWTWSVPVTLLAYMSFFAVILHRHETMEEYVKDNIMRVQIIKPVVCITLVFYLPMIVRFFMALFILNDENCANEWIQHNPLLLWVSIGRAVETLIDVVTFYYYDVMHNINISYKFNSDSPPTYKYDRDGNLTDVEVSVKDIHSNEEKNNPTVEEDNKKLD